MLNKTDNERTPIAFGSDNAFLGNCVFALNIDDSDNELKILISGSYEGEKGSEVDETLDDNIIDILKEAVPVYQDENKLYEIIFPNYIIYQVRNESYCSYDESEIRKGRRLIIFEKSKLLGYFGSVTDCGLYPDEWKHYGVYTEDHIIDVITCEKPIIKRVSNGVITDIRANRPVRIRKAKRRL